MSMATTIAGWCSPPLGGGGNSLDSGHLSGDDAHVGGGHHRVSAAGHVAADARDWDMLVTEHDTRQRFDFDIEH